MRKIKEKRKKEKKEIIKLIGSFWERKDEKIKTKFRKSEKGS